jgi:hypothetical protein
MKNTMIRIILTLTAVTAAFLLFRCSAQRNILADSAYGKECVHCHGDTLQGIKNVKRYCGECHTLRPLSIGAIKSNEMKNVLLGEPHIHKTENIFSSTPSCFSCHRKSDF